MFSAAELRKILVISSLRKTVYYIENMKGLLDDLDTQNCRFMNGAYACIEKTCIFLQVFLTFICL